MTLRWWRAPFDWLRRAVAAARREMLIHERARHLDLHEITPEWAVRKPPGQELD